MPHVIQSKRKLVLPVKIGLMVATCKNREKVTCGEISSGEVKYILFRSTENPRQYYEATLSALPCNLKRLCAQET